MDEPARLSASVPARKETLPFLRDLVGCFAKLLGAGEEAVESVKLAVHEAAANVVEHAYERDGGKLEFDARWEAGTLSVLVADTTTTVLAKSNRNDPHLPSETAEHGRGLPLIGALAEDLELRRSTGTQTEMSFSLEHR